jgi:hypothetical protein
MRRDLPVRLFALSLAGALLLVAGAPAAEEIECFPKCRSGYLCHEGACVSGCNPLCADDEKCTDAGECVPNATPVVTVPTAPPPTPPEAKPPYVPRGIVLGVSAGALACTIGSAKGCDTSKRDAGVYASLRGGYRFLPWLVADLDLSFSPLFMKSTADAEHAILLAAGLGTRFLPLGGKHVVDPVLGLHVGYFLNWTKIKNGNSTAMNGVHLEYTAGVDFKVARVLSLGVVLDVFEPFWLSECDTVGAQAGDPLRGVPPQSASHMCAKPGGGSYPFYFGAGVSGTFLL